MSSSRHTEEVRAVDMEVGGDDDTPGIAQELTTDDIDDIVFDASLPLAERRTRLMELRDEIEARRAGDFMGDMSEVYEHLRDRIAALGNPMESQTVSDSTGMSPDERSDDDDPADHVDDDKAD
jgi:hypothetical protein